MDFRELIAKRRSVREFDGRAVPADLVREIIADSTQAPNARNAQPWSFIVVANADMIKRLSDESKKNILWDMGDNPRPRTSCTGPYWRTPTSTSSTMPPAWSTSPGPVTFAPFR